MAQAGKQLREEADRFEADPFYAATSKNRLDTSQHLTENNKDLTLQELQRDIVFTAADPQERRAQELKNLALLCMPRKHTKPTLNAGGAGVSVVNV